MFSFINHYIFFKTDESLKILIKTAHHKLNLNRFLERDSHSGQHFHPKYVQDPFMAASEFLLTGNASGNGQFTCSKNFC